MKPLSALWRAPLWKHALALALVMIIGIFLSRPFLPFTTDEGAVLLQAKQLHEEGRWTLDLPPHEIDPDGSVSVPYFGERGEGGKTAYAKHPAYPLVLSWLYGLFGAGGAIVLSAVFGFLTALCSAAIARELKLNVERQTLWFVALGTPVFFYSYVVVAHTIACAATAIAGLIVVRYLRSNSIRGRHLAVIALSCIVASAFRTEGAFLGVAIAVAVLLVGPLRRTYLVAVVALTATAATYVGDRVWLHSILGDLAPPSVLSEQSFGFVEGRVIGFAKTVLVDPRGPGQSSALYLVAFIAVTIAAIAFRRRLMLVCKASLVGAVVVYVLALIATSSPVAGLLLVVPVAWFALLQLDRASLMPEPGVRALALTAVALMVCVVLTQYAEGGGLEWGGRYFMVVTPLVAPLLLAKLAELSLERPQLSTSVAPLLTACTLVIALMAFNEMRAPHRTADTFMKVTDGEFKAISQRGTPPYLVFTDLFIPQAIWPSVGTERWLVSDRSHTAATVERLAEKGEPVLLVTSSPGDWLPAFERRFRVVNRQIDPVTDMSLLTLESN